MGMLDKYVEPSSPGLNVPPTTEQTIECKGHVINKTPYHSSGYTHFAVAVLVQFPDSGEMQVVEYSSSPSSALALCRPGQEVKVTLWRGKPENYWVVRGLHNVYDIEREKAALAKLTASK
jgi:hypothetical protein